MQTAYAVIESEAYQTLIEKVNTSLSASYERASLAYDCENNVVIIAQEQSKDILDIEKFINSDDPALLETMLGVFTELDQLTTYAKIAFKEENIDVNVRSTIKQTDSENALYISENGTCEYSAVQIEDIKAKIYGKIEQFIDDKNYEDAVHYCDVLIEYGGYENVEELKKTAEASNKSYSEENTKPADTSNKSDSTSNKPVDMSNIKLGVTESGKNVLVTVKKETDAETVTCVMTFWYEGGKLTKETADYYVPDAETAGVLAEDLKKDATIVASSVSINSNCVSCTMKDSELAELKGLTRDELIIAMKQAIASM